MTMRVTFAEILEYTKEVPSRRCCGDSITPGVATSHQSLKRGEKEVKLAA